MWFFKKKIEVKNTNEIKDRDLNKLEEIACIYGNKITGNMIKDAINMKISYLLLELKTI